MAKVRSRNVTAAIEVIRRDHAKETLPGASELQSLGEGLANEGELGYARKVFDIAWRQYAADPVIRVELGQSLAQSTYKDPDLPSDSKLDQAFLVLDSADPLAVTNSQRSLGLAGAIYKRKWEFEGLRKHLERSLGYYTRGYRQGLSDRGHTGINAAFVLDQLAALEETEAIASQTVSNTAALRRADAKDIREVLAVELSKIDPASLEDQKRWWLLATLGEAYFGLGEYGKAEQSFEKARALPGVPEWEYESTARQVATLDRLQRSDRDHKAARLALKALLGSDDAVERSFAGKVGLALSGGGFRAALFHIGVLARLAELDVLRHVEVLSCVSGGSIVGTHYYLKLQQLLEKNADEPSTIDYISLVEELKREFLDGVQYNVRVRVASNLVQNFKMMLSPNYSRTQRAGELYEARLYKSREYSKIRIPDRDEYYMTNLLVKPFGTDGNFRPKRDNWRRHHKVPALVLNTTTLNTGHTWQFTGTWMGEPPSNINTEIDSNYRLRRMYYNDAPEKHKEVRLGYAVAASACVPGVFEPLSMPDLFEKKTVRLVDGGVHDNQGIGSLIEQDCSILLVSDASGQMESDDQPGDGLLDVPLRSQGILQARVREAQYSDLVSRLRSGLLQGLMFIHMKKDLDVKSVDWIDCPEPSLASGNGCPLTSYGILKKMQQKLAAIRTDLDSFNDIEAYSLMTSGYLMTAYEFAKSKIRLPQILPSVPQKWDFVQKTIGPLSDPADPEHKRFERILTAAEKPALKIWYLSRGLQFGAFTAVAGLIALFWADLLPYVATPLLTLESGIPYASFSFEVTIRGVLTFFAGLLAARLLGKWASKVLNIRKTLNGFAVGVAMIVFGFLLAQIHLLFFDRLYKNAGKL